MGSVVDLRSDTVTRPSAPMRQAMAAAEVGDDVYGEDPTVNHLQQQVAARLGHEAALLVPSGTMANQIALKVLTRPGDAVLVGHGAHNWLFESGAAAAIAGVQLDLLGTTGMVTAAEVRAAYKPDNHLFAPTRLVCVENTHNVAGGVPWQSAELARIRAVAAELGVAAYMDGARLWNAAVATNTTEAELAAGFDLVSVCLSKGLGAPVGSLLCGRSELIDHAHRVRKMLGGGMRQAGVLAAAGLYALEHNRDRLADDHANAAMLARAAAAIDGLAVDVDRVRTNIVAIDVDPVVGTAAVLAERLAERQVLCHALNAQRLRLVTHLDVDRAACERAASALAEVVR